MDTHSPSTKPENEKLEIVPHATFVIDPALRLEYVRLGEDVWVSRDGPEAVCVRSFVS
jgi:hypothetical protein